MLRELHQELGIRADYGQDTGQLLFDEAQELVEEYKPVQYLMKATSSDL